MGSLLNSEIPDEVWEEMDEFFTEEWDPDTQEVHILPSMIKHFGLPRNLKRVCAKKNVDKINELWELNQQFNKENEVQG